MNKITAAAIIASSISWIFGAEAAVSERLNSAQQRYFTLGFVALFSIAWAIDAGRGVSGFLILSLVPIGAAALAFEVSTLAGPALKRHRLLGGLITAALLAVVVAAYVIGFPTPEDALD